MFKKSEIFLKLIFPRREIYWKNHFIINFNIRFLVIYTRIWYDASRNHDIGTSRCISQCDIYRRNCSEQPLLSPNRAKISPDVRRLLKIDSRQYGRKKIRRKCSLTNWYKWARRRSCFLRFYILRVPRFAETSTVCFYSPTANYECTLYVYILCIVKIIHPNQINQSLLYFIMRMLSFRKYL